MNPHDHILWPTGRGLYINCARTQSILINEQEHLRFVSKEMNGDFGKLLTFRKLYKIDLESTEKCWNILENVIFQMNYIFK